MSSNRMDFIAVNLSAQALYATTVDSAPKT